MGLFSFKKKEEKLVKCSCGGMCKPSDIAKKKALEESQNANITAEDKSGIKILGSGCSKCNQLEDATKQALTELGINEEIQHIKDFSKIAAFGVMSTPALVVDGKVLSYGKVLSKEQASELIKKARGL